MPWSRAKAHESAHVPTEPLLRKAFARMVYNIRHENIVSRKFHLKNLDFEPQQNNINHYRQLQVLGAYAPLSILDSPDFEHRGLNLDISRDWIAPRDVLRTIEAMAATKLNQLHLHAADAQTWPLEIPALPELAMKSALDLDQTWSAAELEVVQRHGSAHGVEVFLEIDLPGHARAVGYAYPSLVVAADKEPWSESALEPPAG